MPIDNAPKSETPLTSPQEFYPRTSQNESTLSLEKIRILGKDVVGLGILTVLFIKEDLALFLATHPVPVGMKNIVSVILGEGGTLGLELAQAQASTQNRTL